MTRTLDTVAVVGAGNGGQTTAADLTLQGRRVRLFEFPEYAGGLERLRRTGRFTARGAVSGEGTLELVTTDLAEALDGADAVMVCTQATTLERVAAALAPLVRPQQVVVLNPGSTGGSLRLARHFREVGMQERPDLLEFGTLTYGCRAHDGDIDCPVKVSRVLYGALPAPALERWAPDLEGLFPGLVRARDAFEAGLTNANPVIHPPITLLNGARFENEGADMFFYRDGVSPTVAELIRALDEERMALMAALGYEPVPDPRNSHLQGYAASDDYFEAYAHGPGFAAFRSPDTLNHRYVHEDMGLGLVLYAKLGEVLGVETPASRAFVAMGSVISGIDYLAENGDVLARLGLDGLDRDGIVAYLATGER